MLRYSKTSNLGYYIFRKRTKSLYLDERYTFENISKTYQKYR